MVASIQKKESLLQRYWAAAWKGIGTPAKVVGRTANPFLSKDVVSDATFKVANLLELAAPEISEKNSCGNCFQTLANLWLDQLLENSLVVVAESGSEP